MSGTCDQSPTGFRLEVDRVRKRVVRPVAEDPRGDRGAREDREHECDEKDPAGDGDAVTAKPAPREPPGTGDGEGRRGGDRHHAQWRRAS